MSTRRPPRPPTRTTWDSIPFVGGIPDVTGLRTDEITDSDGDTYMRRYYLTSDYSPRIHHIIKSDIGEDLHDHPWDFTTMLLSGSYVETTRDGDTEYHAPSLLHRTAETPHRLTVTADVWTYIVTGPVRRQWGFHTPTGWQHWSSYLRQDATGTSREW